MGPKVTYTFDLYDNKEDLETFQQANQMSCFIWDFEMYLRSIYKYPPEGEPEAVAKTIEKIRAKFYELKAEQEIKDPT